MCKLPYTEAQLCYLIKTFEATLTILTCPSAAEYKKRDIAALRAVLTERTRENDPQTTRRMGNQKD